MAALAATSLNGVKIYNLASGKTLPQWVAEKTRKALSRDEGMDGMIGVLSVCLPAYVVSNACCC